MAGAVENDEFTGLLDAPHVPTAVKINGIREALGDSVGHLALNLLSILASRGLAHQLHGIVDEYGRLLDAHRGIERAEVVTALPLDNNQSSRITGLLEGMTGRQVRMTSTVESQILGGLIARIGDRVIDGSVKTKLAQMRQDLAESPS